MSILSRIGATPYKFEIELSIQKVTVGAPSSSPTWVEWKRGSTLARTASVGGGDSKPLLVFDFTGKRGAIMKLTSTLYQKKNSWLKKESRITVKSLVGPPGKDKEVTIGIVELDLAEYVRASHEDRIESLTLQLQKCTDKSARVSFNIRSHWMEGAQVGSDEEPSRSTMQSSASQENSLNEPDRSPPSARGGNLDQLDEATDEDDALRARSGKKPAAGSDDDDDDENRRVKFSAKPQGRSSRDGASDQQGNNKKSNLKGAATAAAVGAAAAAAGAAAASSSRGKKPPPPDSEDDDEPAAAAAAPAAAAPAPAASDLDGTDSDDLPCFGVTLERIMTEQAEVSPELDIPLILDVLLRGIERTGGLNLEGLFRVSPASKAREELKRKFEGGDYRLPKDAHIPAALLKYWLAELKEAVIPERLNALVMEAGRIEAPSQAPKIGDEDDEDLSAGGSDSDDSYTKRKKARAAAAKKMGVGASTGVAETEAAIQDALRPILLKLPLLNLRVLARLLTFLNKVASPPNISKTRMSIPALAVVFAPALVRIKMPEGAAAAKPRAIEDFQADVKRSVTFVTHLLNNVNMVEAAARGELKPAAASSSAAPAASPKGAKSKPKAPSSEDDEHSDAAAPPKKSFTSDLSDEDDEPVRPAKGRGKAATAAAAAPAPAPAAAAPAKKPAAPMPRSDTDASEDDAPQPPKSAKAAAAAAAATAAAAAAAATAAAAAKSKASTSAASATSPNGGGRRGRPTGGRPVDDSDDTDEEAAKRDSLFKKVASPAAAAAAAAAAGSSMAAEAASSPATQSIKDSLFAKKGAPAAAAGAGAKAASPTASGAAAAGKKAPPPQTDSEHDSEAEEAAYAARQKEAANAKKQAAAAKEEQAKKDAAALAAAAATAAAAKTKPKPSAAKAFGESDEDADSDEEPAPRAKGGKAAPASAPSPRAAAMAAAAVAATAAVGAGAAAKSLSSPHSASDEVAALRKQLREMQLHSEELESHIVELEEAGETGGASDARVAKLEKENKRLAAENAEIKRSPPHQTHTDEEFAASAAHLAELEEQIVELEEAASTNAVQLKQKDEVIRRQKQQIDDLQSQLDKANASLASSVPPSPSGGKRLKDSEAAVAKLTAELALMSQVLQTTKVDLRSAQVALEEAQQAAAESAKSPSRRNKQLQPDTPASVHARVAELEERVRVSDAALKAAMEAQQHRSPHGGVHSPASFAGSHSGDDRSPDPSPQFDRVESFGASSTEGAFGDINTTGPRSPHAPPPPPPPPPAPAVALQAKKRIEELEAQVAELQAQRKGASPKSASAASGSAAPSSPASPAELLAQLTSHLSVLSSSVSPEALRTELGKVQALLLSKDARVHELLKELKRKDDEVEQLMQLRTEAQLEQAAADSGIVDASTGAVELIDWVSLTDRQKAKKGAALQKAAASATLECKALALRVQQLDRETDEIVESHRARKTELKKANEALTVVQLELEALKAQQKEWAAVKQEVEQLALQLKSQPLVTAAPSASSASAATPAASPGADAETTRELAELQRENARLTKQVEELKRALETPGSGSKQLDSLKKQLASLMSERDDLSRDYDDLELNLTEQQKLVSAARKENKALSAEIQELKAAAANAGSSSSSGLGTKGRMAAAAAAAAGAGAALSRAADRSSGSSGGGSAEEERLREECGLLTLQLEDLRAECDEKLAAERKLRAALQSQILQLRSETDSLRSREVRFADLSVIKSHLDPKKNSKDKLQMDLIDAYESMRARDKFLEGQIKEADATLTNAKNGWIQTISLLQDQVASLEAEVAELKGALENTNKDKPFDQQQFELVQKQLRKSEQARAKLTELVAAAEAEVGRKKLELKTAHQSLIELQSENKRIKEDLVRSGLALKTIAEDNFEMKEYMRMNAKKK